MSHRTLLPLPRKDIDEMRQKLHDAGVRAVNLAKARTAFQVKRRQASLAATEGGDRKSHDQEDLLEADDEGIKAAKEKLEVGSGNVDGTLRLDYHQDLVLTAMRNEETGGQIRKQTRVKDKWADIESLEDEDEKQKVLSYWRNKASDKKGAAQYTEATKTRFAWDPQGDDAGAPEPRTGQSNLLQLAHVFGSISDTSIGPE